MRLRVVLVLALNGTAYAQPIAPSVELAVGGQDVPGAALALVQLRGGVRVPIAPDVAGYARIGGGFGTAVPPHDDAAVIDAAVGVEAQTLTSPALGIRAGFGVQHMRYSPRPPDGFDPEPTGLTSAQFEVRFFIASGRLSFGVELRGHRLIPEQDKPWRNAGGVSIAWRFE